ncbi:purine-nucleoside phosphorylase [Candidatus Uhrbacteria bacterium RIFCSPHIGHO2_02_FULL_60_10]|uniref:Purine-nucleoside phosphorylase n=1 Tax=Candidatus Uhrbacteria bacterium RIFCSPHIGHO2_02_FULL_60_10 TaxID=1802392 RepID=A0A1F7U602_9BACT|nr:MAG: purine-nucleoside phosphorylase [Candidatus Uhrbacteria bacterium RIFCSPHIGHO2_02_FULL_60_10]
MDRKKKMILCSACLLGVECRFDGRGKKNRQVAALVKRNILIPICPELLGGLSVPREAAERRGSRIMTQSGQDVTRQFRLGAVRTLRLAKMLKIKKAILKQRSPSCGSGQVYDGTFSGKIVAGNGVTTALLTKNGIQVVSEDDI